MVHAAMAALQPGEVLVLTMPEPAPVALFGDLLATQAQRPRRRRGARRRRRARHRGARRDGPADVGALGPRRAARPRTSPGELDVPGRSSAAPRSGPATSVVLDADGVAVVAAERVEEVLAASLRARGEGARASARSSQAGALSYDLDGLRAKVEGAARERDRPPRPGRAAHARRARRACAFFVDVLGMEVEAPRRAVGLPARLGRLPALVSLKLTESDTSGHGAGSGCARGAPRRSSAASPRSRRPGSASGWTDGATAAAGRPTASATRTATCFELYYERRALRAARAPAAVAEEPAAALHRPRRGGQAPRPRQHPRRRRPRRPRVRHRRRSATASTSASSSTTAPRPARG